MRLNPKLTFALGWLVGRGQRNPISSSVFMIAGLLILLAGIPTALFGAPYLLIRVRETRALQQPSPAKLRVLPPHSELLIAVTLPDKADASGLALSYVQSRPIQSAQASTPTAASSWKAEAPAPRIEVTLADGSTVPLLCTAKTNFIKAEEIAEPAANNLERRRIGYRAGETITIDAEWNSAETLTARTIYPGTTREYIKYLSWQPGAMLTMGFGCAGLGLLLFAVGLILRYL
jgi:hypothetical protein